MTRINIGISPDELCDQHLLAEYKELPRVRALAMNRRLQYGDPGPVPKYPCLGTGHVSFFLPYGPWLAFRFARLTEELTYRGFKPTYQWWSDYPFHEPMPEVIVIRGRMLLRERILARLATMKRIPTWTNREAPDWVAVCA